jgi:DNA-binding NarL/FixJ family response regulator
MQPAINIAIVDDSDQLKDIFKKNFNTYTQIQICFMAENGADALQKLNEQSTLPDVILMDIDMPIMNGIETVKKISELYPSLKTLMLTVFDDDDKIFQSIQAGAKGYLLKDESFEKIIEAINNIYSGYAAMSPIVASKTIKLLKNNTVPQNVIQVKPEDYQLTAREIQVLELLSAAKSYKQIADELFVSTQTIKKHIENIYTKLHVNSKLEAVFLAQKHKWYK